MAVARVIATAVAGTLGALVTAKFVAEKVFGWTYEGLKDRRRVRVTMHHAAFGESRDPAYFINVANLSRSREVEITHVWVASDPAVSVLRADRPLPRRLKPDETWETWVYLTELPAPLGDRALYAGRVRLSTGVTLKSRPNRSVPDEGSVPGGSIARS